MLFHKRRNITFPIVNFPFISSNIPASPSYEVYLYNPYVIKGLVLSTVFFWTELSYWRKTTQVRLRYSYGEVIAIKILRSSRTGWSLRNTHISNDCWYVPFEVDYYFPPSPTRLLLDLTMSITWRLSYKMQELSTFRDHLGSSPFICCCPCCSPF